MAEMSLLDILNDENYVNANEATKEAIFNKYAPNDTNYVNANDATKEAIRQRFGLSTEIEEPAVKKAAVEPEQKDKYPMLAAAADVPLSFSRGVVNGIQMISDAFGADSAASKALNSADTYLADLMSAQSKKDAAEVSRIMQEAQDKGMWEQVKAGLHALSIAPIDLITNALGTTAPVIIAGLASALAAPEVAGVGLATELGIGAVGGMGTIKGRIYQDVKQALLDKGLSEDRAEAAAQEAQSYNGKNLDSILLGALFGAGASASGVEKTAVKSLASKILKDTAEETVAKAAAKQVAEETIPLRFTKGFIKEAIPEAAQEAQEQVSSNVALQREGEDVPTFRGAAGSATLAGIAGGVLGGGLDVAVGGRRNIHPQQEDDVLLNSLKTLEDFRSPENYLRLAEKHRDDVPILGQILDSGISEDKKIELILKRIGEINLAESADMGPTRVISGEGPRSLPAPPGERTTRPGVSELYNAAIDKGAPLTDLSVGQGPNGFRILSGAENVIADGINNERDARVLSEALSRSYDESQIDKYRKQLTEYDTERRKLETEALAKAASETKTPFQPVTISDVRELAGKEDQHVLTMIALRRNRTGQDMNADITIPELRQLGASKTLIDELIRQQKPYSMGTGKVSPGIVETELGPRPLEPTPTAKGPEKFEAQKAQNKLFKAGNFPEVSEFTGVKSKEDTRKMPRIPESVPKVADVAAARALVDERIGAFEKRGEQGASIAKGLRDALDSGEFDHKQLYSAFKMADVSASLLGDTKGNHDFKFVNRLMSGIGDEQVAGSRKTFSDGTRGLIQLSLNPGYSYIANQTSAHEAFHVLQDMFADSDKKADAVIKSAFKGAKSFDDIDSNLLRVLKTMRSSDGKGSVYDQIKRNVGQDVLDAYSSQDKREREMQAYTFMAMDDSIRRAKQPVSGLGSSFVRFLNYFRNFIDRTRNYFKGQGFQTVEDVFRETTAGKRQAGKSQVEPKARAEAAPEGEESSVRLRRGTETLRKYGVTRGETGVKTRRLAEALEARQREKYGTIERNDYSEEASRKIANWMADEVSFANDQQRAGADSGVGWYSEKYQRALDAFSQIFPELRSDKTKRDIFTAVVALMSDGQKVYNNFSLAGRAYSEYRDTGRFPETFPFGGERRVSMESNLRILNSLIQSRGEQGAIDFLMEERTVSELSRQARADGIDFSTNYKADTRLPMSALVFGPKLGAFFSNLMGSHGYLTMDRWWSRTFNRYRGQLVTRIIGTADKPFNSKGEPIGLARFKTLLAKYDRRNSPWDTISDQEAITRLQDFRDSYEAKGYKNGTEIEKAANTLYKAAFEGTEDQPFNASDRAFMIATANRAKQILNRRGINLSLADIQAVLWYYEKRLYGELGARQTADISYEEAANRVVSDHRDRPDRWITHDAPEATVVGPDGSLIEIGDEGPSIEEGVAEEPSSEEEFSRAAQQTGDNVEEFKRWWGKSKASTPDGNPMPYYHGTSKGFSKFGKAVSGAIVEGEGPFFFSPDPEFASSFAKTYFSASEPDESERVIPVFLSVQKPFDYENPKHISRLLEWINLDRDVVNDLRMGNWFILEASDVQEGIRDAGFDGFFVNEEGVKNLAVFDPKQIKSVFNTFAPGTAESEEFSRAAQQTGDSVEEFKRWWGNSKAGWEPPSGWNRSPLGSPLGEGRAVPARWFHTTKEQFTKFGKAKSGSLEDKEGPFFFTRSLGFLNRFGAEVINQQGDMGYPDGQRSIPVFLSVQKPFDYENKEQVKEVLSAMGPSGKSVYYKEGVKTGDWDIIEQKQVQKTLRDLGYDGFYVNEFGAKNLAVFDPKQIKGAFNTFAPGTAESEEFSNAIARTGQEEEARVVSARFGGLWDGIKEFFKPFALVKNVEELFELRNVSMGTITKSERFARQMSKIIGGASQADRDAVYKYMTTRNADAKAITNDKVREAAMQSKKEINLLAKKMIEQGQLEQESYDKYYDQYLPRLYLYYELTGRGMKTPMGGKSMQEYLKRRNDELSDEDRAILGEIKDPAFLVYVALSRPARDLAMIKYLNNIYAVGEENGWIAPQTLVEWRGMKMTPYDLQHRAMEMREVLKTLREQDPKQADIMEKEIGKMLDIADEGIKSIRSEIKTHELEGFEQMPEHPRYGPLAGAVVKKAIYNDLVGTFIPLGRENMSMTERLIGDENSTIVKLTQLWKLGKTTLNPPTQVTNAISNAIALNLFGGVPLHQYPRLFNAALNGILKNDQRWNDAQDFGLQGGTMSAAELRAAVTRLKAYQFKSGNDTSLIGMFASVRSIMSAVSEGATDAYQFSETLFKFMHYIHEIEKAGPNPTSRQKSNAVNAAHDTLFDYSLVNPNVRYIRNAPIGIPFITYYYKALPKLIETAVKTPWRFLPYVAMAYAIPMATMAAFDIDEDELEKLRKSMAEYIRDNGSLYILPMRDSKGNIEFIDVGRFFPFSTFSDPLITAFKYGEYYKGAKELAKSTVIPNGPLINAIAALSTGVDPFTEKKIYNEFDTPKAQALSILSYVWNQAMPPAINVDLNNMDHSGGALPRIYNALFVDGTGVDKRGLPKPETLESMMRLFGANITPLDAQKQAANNMLYMQNQIMRTKALQTQVARDQSLTPQARTEKIKELTQKIQDDIEKLQQYANDVAGVQRVVRKIRSAE